MRRKPGRGELWRNPGGRPKGSVELLRGLALGEEGEGAVADAVHDVLIGNDVLKLGSDVEEIDGLLILERGLEELELGVEAKGVVVGFNVEAAADFEGEGDGVELIGELLEGGIGGPDEGAGAMAVGTGIGEGLVADEGHAAAAPVAGLLEELVVASVAEEAGEEDGVEADVTIEGRGIHVIGGVDGTEASLGGEVAHAIFEDGDGVASGLHFRMLEGVDDAGRLRVGDADGRDLGGDDGGGSGGRLRKRGCSGESEERESEGGSAQHG